MSLFEWLFESSNPGPIGKVDVGGRGRGRPSPVVTLICFAIAAGLLVLWGYVLIGVWEVRHPVGLVIAALATLAYLFLGYVVHPKPDTSNIGWAGGLFDHPFRYSDDINRTLIFVTAALWPGRFIAESVVDAVRLAMGGSRKRARRPE